MRFSTNMINAFDLITRSVVVNLRLAQYNSFVGGGEILSVRMATEKIPFFALQRHISPALVRITNFSWRWTRQIV